MLTITHKNFHECDRASHELRAHLEDLVRLTQKYPVECTFAEYRFIFRSRADILRLLAQLDEKLAQYRRVA